MAKKKKKRKNSSEPNVDRTSLLFIILGVVLGVMIYSQEQGFLGNMIVKFLLGGLMGQLTLALPVILVVMGFYVIFRDYSRLQLKTFQMLLLMMSVSGLLTCFAYPYTHENPPISWFSAIRSNV